MNYNVRLSDVGLDNDWRPFGHPVDCRNRETA
jgi:hypothetical protein